MGTNDSLWQEDRENGPAEPLKDKNQFAEALADFSAASCS
jgi:hypothetical protein